MKSKKYYVVCTDSDVKYMTRMQLYRMFSDANKERLYTGFSHLPIPCQAITTTMNGVIMSVFHRTAYESIYTREHEQLHRETQAARENKDVYYTDDEYPVDKALYEKYGKAYYNWLSYLRKCIEDADQDTFLMTNRMNILRAM